MGCCASTEEPVETIADAPVTQEEVGVTREEQGDYTERLPNFTGGRIHVNHLTRAGALRFAQLQCARKQSK